MVSVHELNKTLKSIEEMQNLKIRKFARKYAKENREILEKLKEYKELGTKIEKLKREQEKLSEKYMLNHWEVERNLMTKFKEKLLKVKLAILSGDKPDDPVLQKLFEWNPENELQ